MAQNKYLQLLRNSDFAANYEAAVTLIEANAPKLDGAPIIVRFNEGDKVHGLLGVSYNETGAVHYVELGGERIADVKKALQEAIEAAKKAATTKVENVENDAHVEVTASAPAEDGSVTYTVKSKDVASASATTETMTNLQKEIDALEELVGTDSVANQIAAAKEEITSAYTAADEVLDGKISALTESSKVTVSTADSATAGYLKTYVIAQGGIEVGKIDIPKDLVVTKGEIVEKDGEKYLQLTIANQDTPVEIAVKDLVDVYSGSTYIEVGADNTISVKFDDLDAALVAEGTDVKAAIDAAQKAGEDAAAEVNDALTAHTAAYDAKVAELEGEISSAEAAAKEYADGLKEAVDAYTVNGQALVDGAWTVGAEHINGTYNVKVDETTTTAITESVQVSIQAIKNELATLNGGVGSIGDQISAAIGELDAEVSGASNNVTVKVTEVDGKLTAVEVTDSVVVVSADENNAIVEGAEGGAYLSNVWDCGTF